MARSYYTDGTSALDMRTQVSGSNVVAFERRAAIEESNCFLDAVCNRIFRGEPCAHDLYSFESEAQSASEKLKALLAVAVPAIVMFAAIVVPALF